MVIIERVDQRITITILEELLDIFENKHVSLSTLAMGKPKTETNLTANPDSVGLSNGTFVPPVLERIKAEATNGGIGEDLFLGRDLDFAQSVAAIGVELRTAIEDAEKSRNAIEVTITESGQTIRKIVKTYQELTTLVNYYCHPQLQELQKDEANDEYIIFSNGLNGVRTIIARVKFIPLPPGIPGDPAETKEAIPPLNECGVYIPERTMRAIKTFAKDFEGVPIYSISDQTDVEIMICGERYMIGELNQRTHDLMGKNNTKYDPLNVFWEATLHTRSDVSFHLYDGKTGLDILEHHFHVVDITSPYPEESDSIPVSPDQLVDTLSRNSCARIDQFLQKADGRKVEVGETIIEHISKDDILRVLRERTEYIFEKNPDINRAGLFWIARELTEDTNKLVLLFQNKESRECVDFLRFVILNSEIVEEVIPEPESPEIPEPEAEIEVETEPEPVEEVEEAPEIVEIVPYYFAMRGMDLDRLLTNLFPDDFSGPSIQYDRWKIDVYSATKPELLPDSIELTFNIGKEDGEEYIASIDWNGKKYTQEEPGTPQWMKYVAWLYYYHRDRMHDFIETEPYSVAENEWENVSGNLLKKLQDVNFVVEFADGTTRYLYANSPNELMAILREIGAEFEGEEGKEKLVRGQQFEVNEQEEIIQIRVVGGEGKSHSVKTSRDKKENGKRDHVLTLHELSDDEMKKRRRVLRARMTKSDTELNDEGIKAYGKKVILAVFNHEKAKQEDTPEGLMKAYLEVVEKYNKLRAINDIALTLIEFWDIPEGTFDWDGDDVHHILKNLVSGVLKEIVETKIAPKLNEAVASEVGGEIQTAELPGRGWGKRMMNAFGLGESDEERLKRVNERLQEFFKLNKVTNLRELDKVIRLLNMFVSVVQKERSIELAFSQYWESLAQQHESLFIAYAEAHGVNAIKYAKTVNDKQTAWNRLNLFEQTHYKNGAKTQEKEKFEQRAQQIGQLGEVGLHVLVKRITTFQDTHKEAIVLVNEVGGSGEAKKKDEKVKTKEVEVVVDPEKRFEELMERMTPEQGEKFLSDVKSGQLTGKIKTYDDAINLAELVLKGTTTVARLSFAERKALLAYARSESQVNQENSNAEVTLDGENAEERETIEKFLDEYLSAHKSQKSRKMYFLSNYILEDESRRILILAKLVEERELLDELEEGDLLWRIFDVPEEWRYTIWIRNLALRTLENYLQIQNERLTPLVDKKMNGEQYYKYQEWLESEDAEGASVEAKIRKALDILNSWSNDSEEQELEVILNQLNSYWRERYDSWMGLKQVRDETTSLSEKIDRADYYLRTQNEDPNPLS